jgi:hypothetical protein
LKLLYNLTFSAAAEYCYGDACSVWDDWLKKEMAALGPVALIYSDAPMFIDPYLPRGRMAMLKQEPYPTNAAALPE